MHQESFKLIITKPCTKNWDAMLKTNDGRHCNSCKKDVIDFSRMNDAEVQNYFLQNKDKETCGRFYSNQLDRIKIHLPQNILQSDISHWKKYIIILMICFGTNLFSVEVVLGQTIDSLPAKDSTKIVDTLKVSDSIKAIDTTFVIDTTPKIDTPNIDWTKCMITGNAIQTINVDWVLGGAGMIPTNEPFVMNLDEINWNTSMGYIQTIPDESKTLIEILKEDSITNEPITTTLSSGFSKPVDKKPSKKQKPPQQQEFIIPDEIKIKRRK